MRVYRFGYRGNLPETGNFNYRTFYTQQLDFRLDCIKTMIGYGLVLCFRIEIFIGLVKAKYGFTISWIRLNIKSLLFSLPGNA